MSFHAPYFNFFDAISNEVDNFNRSLGNYGYDDYRPRRGLPSNNRRGNRGNKSDNRPSGRELQRRNNNDFGSLTTDLDPWFDEDDEDWGLLPSSDFAKFGSSGLTPPVDLLEHDNNYELNVNVPGIRNRNNINVDYHRDSNQLEVAGEVPSVITEENRGRVKVQEVQSGSFRRVIPLPKRPGVDADGIRADYSSGILKVEIPKLKPTGPREGVHRIDITSQDSWDE